MQRSDHDAEQDINAGDDIQIDQESALLEVGEIGSSPIERHLESVMAMLCGPGRWLLDLGPPARSPI